MVKELAELMGGSGGASSEVGKGSEFVVTLPIDGLQGRGLRRTAWGGHAGRRRGVSGAALLAHELAHPVCRAGGEVVALADAGS